MHFLLGAQCGTQAAACGRSLPCNTCLNRVALPGSGVEARQPQPRGKPACSGPRWLIPAGGLTMRRPPARYSVRDGRTRAQGSRAGRVLRPACSIGLLTLTIAWWSSCGCHCCGRRAPGPPCPAAAACRRHSRLRHTNLSLPLAAVGNLSYDLTEQDVIDHFSQVGPVKHVRCGRLVCLFSWGGAVALLLPPPPLPLHGQSVDRCRQLDSFCLPSRPPQDRDGAGHGQAARLWLHRVL